MSDNVGIVGDSSCSVTIILLPVVNGVEVNFVGMTVLSAFYDLSTMIIIHTYYSIIILSTLWVLEDIEKLYSIYHTYTEYAVFYADFESVVNVYVKGVIIILIKGGHAGFQTSTIWRH